MIAGLTRTEAARLVKTHVCGCGSALVDSWGGSWGVAGPVVRCLTDIEHSTYQRIPRTRILSDGREYDVYTQQPIDIHTREGEMVLAQNPELQQTLAAPPAISTQPMTIEEFDKRMALIEHVATTMKPNIHYGIIPGTSDKSLWEPGAEYLRAAFNIAWGYEDITPFEDYDNWVFRYKFRAFQLLAPGVEGPSWVASCDSREAKFNNMEKTMLPHNVRDRALKRAFVGLIRNVTGTSGYFKDAVAAGDAQPMTCKCADHSNKNFRRYEKDGRIWYSHKEGTGYCNASKDLIAKFEAERANPGGADGEVDAPPPAPTPHQAAQGAPRAAPAAPQPPKGTPGARSQPQASSCGLHGNIRLGKHPEFGMVHKLEDGRFCDGQELFGAATVDGVSSAGTSPYQGEDDPDLPPGTAQDEAELLAALAAQNYTEKEWCNQFLRVPNLAAWRAQGKTLAAAWVFVPGGKPRARQGGG